MLQPNCTEAISIEICNRKKNLYLYKWTLSWRAIVSQNRHPKTPSLYLYTVFFCFWFLLTSLSTRLPNMANFPTCYHHCIQVYSFLHYIASMGHLSHSIKDWNETKQRKTNHIPMKKTAKYLYYQSADSVYSVQIHQQKTLTPWNISSVEYEVIKEGKAQRGLFFLNELF